MMSFPSVNPVKTKAWKALLAHFSNIKNEKIVDYFAENPRRAEEFSMEWEDFFVDFSKNRITAETLKLLLDLAEETKLREAIEAQFSGEKINQTENRAVLHTALRNFDSLPPEVAETQQKMRRFSEEIISGNRRGYTGKPITDIVNIGIGGSDLGPDMVTESLTYYRNHLGVHFVSNVDGDHVQEALKKLDRETTLFIIVSKTFTTQETLTNVATIRSWFLEKAAEKDIEKHFVAVSTNIPAVTRFGIAEENIFPMWDWVGGRFSLWSAVGLSICCAVGYSNFEKLLQGAHQMDKHFKETPFRENIPVILALLSVWYNNFYKAESEAVIPYTQYLQKLVPYLQQAIMESNGKSVDRSGNSINYQTGTIVWGAVGTNAQHAFFQLIHQGTKLIPADFIGFKKPLHGNQEHHDILMANFFAQTEALMKGKTEEEVRAESENQPQSLFPYKVFEGNNPTNTLLIEKLTPENLGSLVAMYEHKIFVQGVIWNIFSFDQWGVELGKQLAKTILNDFSSEKQGIHDASTAGLIKKYL